MRAGPRSGACGGRERGSMAVEACLVLPLLVLLVLAAVDIGMWVFQTTQAASAARTGARVGILAYRQADQANSADQNAIRLGVAGETLGQPGVSVQIRCVGPGDTAALAGGCQEASVVSPDRIMVKVSWARPSLTFVTRPFGATKLVTATAVMVINGRPSSVLP